MAKTTFSGPVQSDNGFIGTVTGDVVGVTVTATGTLVVGATSITSGSVVSGTVGSTQLGYLPIKIGSTTKYIPLYTSLTL
jgi:hypothetical protein